MVKNTGRSFGQSDEQSSVSKWRRRMLRLIYEQGSRRLAYSCTCASFWAIPAVGRRWRKAGLGVTDFDLVQGKHR
jgi:hypothetical protein